MAVVSPVILNPRGVVLGLLAVLAIAAAFVCAGPAGAQEPPVATYVPGEVLAVLKPGAQTALRARGLTVAQASPYGQLVRVKVSPGLEERTIADLLASPGVVSASLNHILYATLVPDDPYYSYQWALPKIEALTAWSLTQGSPAVTVALVDSGLDMAHVEFSGRIVDAWDEIEGDALPQDTCGHGTHVAGIAGARGNNSVGVAGMAWEISLMPVRVLSANGSTCSGTEAAIHDGIYYAVDHGAQIINLSLGGSPLAGHTCEQDYPVMSAAIQYAYAAGRLVVAAAGNSYASRLLCPALQPEALAVGATTSTDERAAYSNTGDGLELMAPGSSISSTVPGGYDTMSGTSMAAPHVAGLAALLWSLEPGLTRDAVREIMRASADDLGSPGPDSEYGYGRINAGRALLSRTADLSASGAVTPDPAPAGRALTYTLHVTNAGPLTATGVSLVATLPDGLAPAETPDGCVAAGGVLTCTLDSLAPAGGATYETAVVPPLAASGVLTGSLTVAARQPDPDAGNNSAYLTVSIQRIEVLSLTKTAVPSLPMVGQPLTYTLSAANLACAKGTSAADVVVTDTLPAGLTFGWADVQPGGTCLYSDHAGGGTFVCQLGTLGVCGQLTATAVIQVVLTPTLPGVVTNTACIASRRAGAVCTAHASSAHALTYMPLIKKDSGAGDVVVQ